MPVLNGYRKWDRRIRGTPESELMGLLYPIPSKECGLNLERLVELVIRFRSGDIDGAQALMGSAFSWGQYERELGRPVQDTLSLFSNYGRNGSPHTLKRLQAIIKDWDTDLKQREYI